jgi:hypothetical protein
MPIRPDQEGEIVLHDGARRLVREDGIVLQGSSTGNTHAVAAGSTTSVFTNTTFDGSTGATAYTLGDVVKALKGAGVLAA